VECSYAFRFNDGISIDDKVQNVNVRNKTNLSSLFACMYVYIEACYVKEFYYFFRYITKHVPILWHSQNALINSANLINFSLTDIQKLVTYNKNESTASFFFYSSGRMPKYMLDAWPREHLTLRSHLKVSCKQFSALQVIVFFFKANTVC
jgi:hypothetical protein